MQTDKKEMKDVTTLKNSDFGEIRVGLDKDSPDEAYVTLALNHFENDEQWGGQPLTPELARHIGCLLIEYAAKADGVIQTELKKICPF